MYSPDHNLFIRLVKANVVSSRIHGYSYSIVAYQAAYLATRFPAVYWNTAYLRVTSGLDDESTETIVPIYEQEKDEMSFGTTYKDLPDRSGKIKKTSSTNYCKLAKGVGEIISHGIKVSLIDINKSGYMFEPDEENNAIIFGMKGLNGVGGEIVEKIIESRPYDGLDDFLSKVKCSKTVVISLIKAGAFDNFASRKAVMTEYIWETCSPKKKITMQNFNGLREKGLVPQSLSFQNRLFFFNKCLKKNQKVKGGYRIENNYYDFFEQFFDIDVLEINSEDNTLYIKESVWKKLYDAGMKPAKEWIVNNQEEILENYNKVLFQEEWDKYAAGTISAWEMDSLGFYYHDHELENVDDRKYDIVEFNTLPETPIIERVFKKGGREIPIYKTDFIFGTVIAKDDTKNIVTLLTKRSGIVNVKFTRDFYARLKSQISEKGADGKKKAMETGWFKRGTILAVNGFRRNNTFVGKSYKKSAHHQCYKITDVFEDGTINMTYLRYGEGE